MISHMICENSYVDIMYISTLASYATPLNTDINKV